MVGNREVFVEDYNDEWELLFEELKTIYLCQLKKLALAIEHVGSTSVPGLAAKPILDIDIVIDSMTLLPQVIEKLTELGYYHRGNLGIEGREAFGRPNQYVPYTDVKRIKMEHHLYVCDKDSRELNRHLTFRNKLRENAHLIDEYARLKKKLAIEYRNNREAYTNGKTLFITQVLKMSIDPSR